MTEICAKSKWEEGLATLAKQIGAIQEAIIPLGHIISTIVERLDNMDIKRAQEITKVNNSLGEKNKQLIHLQSDNSILKVRWCDLQSVKDIQIIQLQSEK